MTSSKIFFYFCLSFIAGIFIGSFLPTVVVSFYLFFTIIVGAILFLAKFKKAALAVFCLLFLILGIWRYQSYDRQSRNDSLRQYNGQSVVLYGKILTEPDLRENSAQITLNVQRIGIGKEILSASGKVLIKTEKYPQYNYADTLVIRGTLREAPVFEGFNYKEYLAKKGIFSVMDWPKISLFQKSAYSNYYQYFYAKILDFKNKIRESVNQSFPYLEAKLLSGILLGDQSSFPADFKDKLNAAGLRHITAISGMNIAILCSILMSLFLGLGFWRGQAFYFTLIAILFFVLMIGFQASVVRAGIMGAVFLLAQKAGRMPTSTRIIIITAAIMILINPMLLRWDVGFQLSFLAMMGIILLNSPISSLLKFIPEEKFINLRSIISATLSAQIFTLPILIFNFGRISLIAPISNILVVPIVDLVMVFGFIFAILNVIYAGLGWIFIWPCWFLLAYTLKIVDIFSAGWMQKTFENVHWAWLIALYFIISVFVVWLKRKIRNNFLSY